MAEPSRAADPHRPPPIGRVHATALGAAVMRGGHLADDAQPKVFADGYALALAGVSEADARESVRREDANGAVSSMWALRSRFAEDRLAAARAEGRVAQYVILGAGLDSFALRMAGRLQGLTVFEVDDPPMQAWKRWRLSALGMATPPELRFAPCDFERATLAECLAPTGYDPMAPTFISWLGVTQYLDQTTIEATLRWAAVHSAGSEMVVSFCTPGPRSEMVRGRFAARGVRFSTFFAPDEMTRLLAQAGFGRVEHLSIAQANRAYYRERRDTLPWDLFERVVSATVA